MSTDRRVLLEPTRAGIEAALRAAGFPVAGPDDSPCLPGCVNCGCDVFAHERHGASRCRTCRRCPGWLPRRG